MTPPPAPDMNAPKRIRLSRAKGWRLPEGTVNVARPGPWGNPFVVGVDGTRAECAALYEFVIGNAGMTCLTCEASGEDQRRARRQVADHIGELRGRDLACWCALDGGPCHADHLLRWANA